MAAWGCATMDAFGDGPALADELGALIAAGVKTATCGSLAAYEAEGLEPPKPGERELVLDGGGRPWSVIEWTGVFVRPFDEVDEAFAHEEGEGDRSLDSWRREHEKFFRRNGGFDPKMPLVCCRFKLIHTWPRGDLT
jgi:uncharacterized protein YhfF